MKKWFEDGNLFYFYRVPRKKKKEFKKHGTIEAEKRRIQNPVIKVLEDGYVIYSNNQIAFSLCYKHNTYGTLGALDEKKRKIIDRYNSR